MTPRMILQPEVLGRLDEILGHPAGRRIGVLGLGVAGRAMALLAAGRGARVLGADRRSDVERAPFEKAGVELRLGAIDAETFADVELLVISPGADPTQPAIAAALERGTPVCGELELAGKIPAEVVAITGTNGKSTTTALLGALVSAAGKKTFVGGNLGEPLTAWLASDDPVDVAVVELSSYQLETAYRFSADVAVVLNITPDHLDRYPDIESYADTKQRLVENLGADGVAVLNHDDARVVAMAEHCAGRVWWFGTAAATNGLPGDGATLDGDTLVPHGALEKLGRIDLSHPRLIGRHNRENALAAWVAAAALGVATETTRDAMLQGYLAFRGLEHRLELVADISGVRYINDSKATNDDAAAIALHAMDRPVILLAGGRGKGAGYAKLVDAALNRARIVVAFGEDREAVAEAFSKISEVVTVGSMRQAFDAAVDRARDGDTVLLAPACASFDEFENFGARGRAFKLWVDEIQGRAA